MGRLGFNLVGQKDMEKAPQTEMTPEEKPEKVPVAETVVVVDKLDNQKNENSEESDLRAEIRAKNLTISKLRALASCLGLVLIMTIIFVLFFSPVPECSQPEDTEALLQQLRQKFHLSGDDTLLVTGFLGARENRAEVARLEMQADGNVMNVNYTALIGEIRHLRNEKTNLEKRLELQKSQFELQNDNTMRKLDILQKDYMAIQTRKEELAAEFAAKEKVMHDEIVALQDERADLEKKIEAGNKKLQELQQRNSRQQQRQQQQQVAVKTTTEQPSRGLFGDGQLKKFNDLVKDIETGAVLYDFNSFLKRTDEVFRL